MLFCIFTAFKNARLRNLTKLKIIFPDLISEYQQYQEATVDDYDSDDADKSQDED